MEGGGGHVSVPVNGDGTLVFHAYHDGPGHADTSAPIAAAQTVELDPKFETITSSLSDPGDFHALLKIDRGASVVVKACTRTASPSTATIASRRCATEGSEFRCTKCGSRLTLSGTSRMGGQWGQAACHRSGSAADHRPAIVSKHPETDRIVNELDGISHLTSREERQSIVCI
jgi:hypothetical protein